jgi:type II secretory pathway pseudopilin PulG
LIEILVAFTVLALVAVPAMQVASGHLRALRISEQYARATSLARSKLDELVALSKLGAERPVLEGVTGRTTMPGVSGWRSRPSRSDGSTQGASGW